MSMRDLEQGLEVVQSHSELADFFGNTPEWLIARAEGALGLKFPPTYREFIRNLGACSLGFAEFYGVIDSDFEHSGVPDAIWLTLDCRSISQTPESFILVSDTGDGAYYVIDVSQVDAHGESPVLEWWPGLPDAVGNPAMVAEDFGAFFLRKVKAAAKIG